MKIKLSQTIVNNYTVPDDKKQIELVDEGGTGLYLLATQAGARTFYLRYRSPDTGKTTHVKLGRAEDITLVQARAKVKTLRAEIALGDSPQAKVKQLRNEITYREFMEDLYFPYITPRRRNAKKYLELWTNKILPALGSTKVNAMSKRQVQAFHSDLQAQGYSNAYCNRHLQLIKSSINVGINIMEVIDIKNPAVGIPLFDEEGRERYLDSEELGRLMPVLNDAEGQLAQPARIIRFLLATGLRLGECLHCRWEHIDVENRVMLIPSSRSKSKKPDSISLSLFALKTLETCDRDLPYPFANSATGRPYVSIKKSFRALMDKAGLEGVTAHTCRHTAASMMINAGQSLYAVQRVLRHSSSSVTEKYAHLSQRSVQDASDTISEQLLRAGVTEKESNVIPLEKASGEN